MNAAQVADVKGYVAYIKNNPENAFELVAVAEDLLAYIDLLHEDLRAAQKAAWDEGYTSGSVDTHNDGLYDYAENPYRKDTE